MKFKLALPLQTHISTLFLTVIIILGGATTTYSFMEETKMLENSAEVQQKKINQILKLELNNIIQPAETAADIVSYSTIVKANSYEDRFQSLGLLRSTLQSGEDISAVYVGYSTGDFLIIVTIKISMPQRVLNTCCKALNITYRRRVAAMFI
jgi:hypothetical protein